MGKWLRAIRVEVQVASILPAILGSVFGYYETGNFSVPLFLLTLIGVILIHAGANLINDYYDHVTGTDALNETYLPGFSGGSRVIQDGTLSPGAIKKAAYRCFTAGSAIGLVISYFVGLPVLIIGIVGVVTSILYVSPKYSLTNKGFGEFVVGLDFGVLIVMGAYYVQAGQFTWSAFLISLPMALVVASILMVNQIPDYDSDKLTGKITSAVRFGRKNSARTLIIFLFCTIGIVMASIPLEILPLRAALAFLVVPVILKTARVLMATCEMPQKMVSANLGVIQCHVLTALFVIAAMIPGVWGFVLIVLPILLSIKTYKDLHIIL